MTQDVRRFLVNEPGAVEGYGAGDILVLYEDMAGDTVGVQYFYGSSSDSIKISMTELDALISRGALDECSLHETTSSL